MTQTLKEWAEAHKLDPPLTYDELHHDDVTHDGIPSIDRRLLGVHNYYLEVSELVENHPIPSAGIIRLN
jgi:hypothetical protein